MRTLCAATLLLALAPRPSDACAVKDNDVAIVVGVVGSDVAILRIALHEQERANEMVKTEWSGAATLVIGSSTTSIGKIDPKLDPNLEIERLTTLARDRAKKLDGFIAATQLDETDCSDKPGARCGKASLKDKSLRIGKVSTSITDDAGAITGLVRYQAGGTEITVINVGIGDPRFSTSVRPCSANSCRTITTLHHGEQKDMVVVTRRDT